MFKKIFDFIKKDKSDDVCSQDEKMEALNNLKEAYYTDDMAKLEGEKATIYKDYYGILLATCNGNKEKEKAFKDVVMACILFEKYPTGSNLKILDDKLAIADLYDK